MFLEGIKQSDLKQDELDLMEFDSEEQESSPEDSKIVNPYNPDQVDIVSNPMTISLLLDRINNNELELNPDFQRKAGLWDDTKKSRLIESILIKVPLPIFYFDSRDDERWTIVDGLQRITTFNDYILKNSFKLVNLEYLTDLDGVSFNDLPRSMQRRIRECIIQTYCIRKGTPDDVTISIFKRINTGGITLSLAEIRNCVFHGIAGNLIKDMASSEAFKIATRYRISPDRMDDRDLVTRFTAFYVQGYEKYDGNMDSFLEQGLVIIKETFSQRMADELMKVFERTMICCREVFGDYAFRKKIQNADMVKFGPLNKSLFECVSTCIGLLSEDDQRKLTTNKDDFFESYKLLFDQPFYYSINSATGSKDHVFLRHQELSKLLMTKIRSYE